MKNIVKYDGSINIGNFELPCYVLEDGTRIISGRGMQSILKMVDDEDGKLTSGSRLNRYLNQKTLEPFIYKGREVGHFEPLECHFGKTIINGFEATVLIDICDGFLEARKKIKLSARQEVIAQQCEMLVRSFAKVGLIALIDEATGYQYDREKQELQVIFKEFISDEILQWQQAFHLSFYKEIFRLWNIPFTEKYIKRKPQFIGHITNRFIYQNLPKGTFVLEKLKEKTPKAKSGGYKYRLHQSLTPDVGRESLKKVIYTVETLASISDTKRQFIRHINDKYGQREIPFTDLEEIDVLAKKEDAVTQETTNFDKQLKGLLNVPPPKKDVK